MFSYLNSYFVDFINTFIFNMDLMESLVEIHTHEENMQISAQTVTWAWEQNQGPWSCDMTMRQVSNAYE